MNDIASNTQHKHILIAYHENCVDGFTAAWVAYKALTSKYPLVICHLHPMSYNKESDIQLLTLLATANTANTAYEELYVVDFSLDIGLLEQIVTAHPYMKTIILDHHKTAFERYCPNVEVTPEATWSGGIRGASIVLNNNESGASLCWKYFQAHTGHKYQKPMYMLIRYVRDYDLWRFELPETKAVSKYLAQENKGIYVWDRIAKHLETDYGTKMIVKEGEILLAQHDATCAAIAKLATPIIIGAHKGLAVSCPRRLTSSIGHILATASGTFGAMYLPDTERGIMMWSLRSNADFDVSAIAKGFGGGGHKNAAGFETPLLGGKS